MLIFEGDFSRVRQTSDESRWIRSYVDICYTIYKEINDIQWADYESRKGSRKKWSWPPRHQPEFKPNTSGIRVTFNVEDSTCASVGTDR